MTKSGTFFGDTAFNAFAVALSVNVDVMVY